MLGDVADAFRMVDSGVSAAAAVTGGFVCHSVPPSTASDFVNALQKRRSGDRLRGRAIGSGHDDKTSTRYHA